ncbi:MAG: NADH:flavin oxidoreductase/NADH oxidase family protein [Desulfobacterales bacterium]|nr:MAG: NADH:flavin oxidoreductase/NADH oxidase family protein [Desulfobacterales bacterium]
MLDTSLTLPSGAVIKNRIVKAAMSDGLADSQNHATEKHCRLYRRWSEGGAGLLIIGEVQVDHRHPERPGNIALDRPEGKKVLRAMTAAGTIAGNHFWAQLGHAGALTFPEINSNPLAPSAVPVRGNQPQAMTEPDILDLIECYANAAAISREVGFTGIEIHAAHGFLLSQFLSPRFNQRIDDWGGSLENRARLLIEIVRAVRVKIGEDYPIAVKLNATDFQEGGFSFAESQQVARWLDREHIDLLAISGRIHKSDDDAVPDRAPSTGNLAPEGYFLDYASTIKKTINAPVMVTGGFRTRAGIMHALEYGLDLIGLARPLVVDAELPRKLLAGTTDTCPRAEDRFSFDLPFGAGTAWFQMQIIRMGNGMEVDLSINPEKALEMIVDFDHKAAQRYYKDLD